MDGYADIPPSCSGFSPYPTIPFGDGGDECSDRASMQPPHGSSLPPLPPCFPIQPTGQQYGSQTFPGSSPSPSMLSQPSSFRNSPSATVANEEMTRPPLPNTMLNSFAGGSGSSLPSSVFSRPPSATVANKYMAFPLGSSKAHKRGSSDRIQISRLNSLLAQKNRIYRKPIETPVGEGSQKESVGEKSPPADVNVGFSNIGNKRRAGNEIAPPSKIWRGVPVDNSSINGNSSVGDEPPQGVSADVGNDNNAFGGVFTADQLRRISACDTLKAMAASNPKHLKRVLSNREAAARSKEKKALRQYELEVKVGTLENQIDTLIAELKLEKRERMAADEECQGLRIRLNGGEEQAQTRDALIERLTEEVHRLTEVASRQREEVSRLREEVSEYRRRESERMNANMFEQLDINQQFQEKPWTNYNFE